MKQICWFSRNLFFHFLEFDFSIPYRHGSRFALEMYVFFLVVLICLAESPSSVSVTSSVQIMQDFQFAFSAHFSPSISQASLAIFLRTTVKVTMIFFCTIELNSTTSDWKFLRIFTINSSFQRFFTRKILHLCSAIER